MTLSMGSMETRDFMDFYEFVCILVVQILGFSYEFILTLDFMKFGLGKP